MQMRDGAIIHNHREAAAARTEAPVAHVGLETCGAGEVQRPIADKGHGVLGAMLARPGVEHEGIVDGDAGHSVDAAVRELLGIFDEAGQMLQMTGRRKGAGQREQDDAERQAVDPQRRCGLRPLPRDARKILQPGDGGVALLINIKWERRAKGSPA